MIVLSPTRYLHLHAHVTHTHLWDNTVEVVRNVINAGRLDIVTDIYRTMEVTQHLEKWPMKEGLSGLILFASHYTLCLHAINLSLSPLLRVYANAEYTSPTNGLHCKDPAPADV